MVSMGHAYPDVMAMFDVMPVARWVWDVFLDLDSNRDLHFNLLELGTLLRDLSVDLDGDVHLDGHLNGDGDPTLYKNVNLLRYVDLLLRNRF